MTIVLNSNRPVYWSITLIQASEFYLVKRRSVYSGPIKDIFATHLSRLMTTYFVTKDDLGSITLNSAKSKVTNFYVL